MKIADHGKYEYEQNKLKRKWAEEDKEKGKKKERGTKHTQIKPGTGGDILNMRAKKIRGWLDDGDLVQIDLFLFGRYKKMEPEFLKGKLENFIKTIPGEINKMDEMHKSSKGYTITLKPDDSK